MKRALKKDECQLLIIGTGMTGMAAALFAADKQIDSVQVGMTGEIGFASGLIDLLGVHPVVDGTVLTDPWRGIERLCQDEPRHPYAKLTPVKIQHALAKVKTFLKDANYPHVIDSDRNVSVLTPVGTLKTTYMIPHSMAQGPSALTRQRPCLLVDFKGLKGFSGRQIAENLSIRWPELKTERIIFPDSQGDLYPEHLARALDAPQTCQALVAAIKPKMGNAQVVALPAVLGVHRTLAVETALTQGLGVPVFEVPTMLPSVPGLRLREIFEQRLPAMGIRPFYQQKILHVSRMDDGRWSFDIGSQTPERTVIARSAILCSGRFFGNGLQADRHGIHETIFNLPVTQPNERGQWHHKDLFHAQGHPVNRSGLEIDAHFRPADAAGRAVYANLFAAGSILAHQDWIRQKCGSGLAIATASGAVAACQHWLDHHGA